MRTLLLVSKDRRVQDVLEAGGWAVARTDGMQQALVVLAELHVDGVVLDLRAPTLALAGVLRGRICSPIIALIPSFADPNYAPFRLAQAGVEDAVAVDAFDADAVGRVLEWACARKSYCIAARRLKTARRIVADLTEAVQRAQQVFVLSGNGTSAESPPVTAHT